jgi:hypothetical protein
LDNAVCAAKTTMGKELSAADAGWKKGPGKKNLFVAKNYL